MASRSRLVAAALGALALTALVVVAVTGRDGTASSADELLAAAPAQSGLGGALTVAKKQMQALRLQEERHRELAKQYSLTAQKDDKLEKKEAADASSAGSEAAALSRQIERNSAVAAEAQLEAKVETLTKAYKNSHGKAYKVEHKLAAAQSALALAKLRVQQRRQAARRMAESSLRAASKAAALAKLAKTARATGTQEQRTGADIKAQAAQGEALLKRLGQTANKLQAQRRAFQLAAKKIAKKIAKHEKKAAGERGREEAADQKARGMRRRRSAMEARLRGVQEGVNRRKDAADGIRAKVEVEEGTERRRKDALTAAQHKLKRAKATLAKARRALVAKKSLAHESGNSPKLPAKFSRDLQTAVDSESR